MKTNIMQQFDDVISKMDTSWRIFDKKHFELLQKIIVWLQSPELKTRVIHIAGTNGKGSVGAILESVLSENGSKVVRFSTPYIVNELEQITFNKANISQQDFLEIYREILVVLKKHNENQNTLSYFEWWSIVALVFSLKKNADFLIYEVGVGGRDDATNAISQSFISVFTKIDLDHMAILGNSLTEIADNKSDIIKENSIVVVAPDQKKEVVDVIEKKAIKQNAVFIKSKRRQIKLLQNDLNGLSFEIDGKIYKLHILGKFQQQNLQLVFNIIDVLNNQGIRISHKAILNGVKGASIIGRLSYKKSEHLLFSGSHNPNGLQSLVESLKGWHLVEKPILIIGILKDKDYAAMVDILVPIASRIITITPQNAPRSLSSYQLASEIISRFPKIPVDIAADPGAAISLAQSFREKDELIIATGSIYTLRALYRLRRDVF